MLLLLQGPPPGFGMAPASDGNAPSGFPSHSGSDGSVTSMYDQHARHWPPSHDAQQHWSHFQQPHSSSSAASTHGNALGLHHSHSAGPSGLQAEPFAMPGLSNLQSMRQQPGTDHSLFSGSSNVQGFPPSQFRQRSRFQFAQDQSAALGPDFASPSMFSSLVSPAVQQHSNAARIHHSHDHLQHGRQHPDHYLFSSSSAFSGGSLFSGPPGMSKPNSVPHRLSAHMAVGSPGGDAADGNICMMGSPGWQQASDTHMQSSHGTSKAYCSMPLGTVQQVLAKIVTPQRTKACLHPQTTRWSSAPSGGSGSNTTPNPEAGVNFAPTLAAHLLDQRESAGLTVFSLFLCMQVCQEGPAVMMTLHLGKHCCASFSRHSVHNSTSSSSYGQARQTVVQLPQAGMHPPYTLHRLSLIQPL